MKVISHRGNIVGPSSFENEPSYVKEALNSGFDVEVDVRTHNGNLFLGHDEPQYEIDIDFLENEGIWCHCKDLDSLNILLATKAHYFFHSVDDVAITSRGIIWTYPNRKLLEGSVCVLPENGFQGDISKCYGICTDFVEKYLKILKI